MLIIYIAASQSFICLTLQVYQYCDTLYNPILWYRWCGAIYNVVVALKGKVGGEGSCNFAKDSCKFPTAEHFQFEFSYCKCRKLIWNLLIQCVCLLEKLPTGAVFSGFVSERCLPVKGFFQENFPTVLTTITFCDRLKFMAGTCPPCPAPHAMMCSAEIGR